MSASDSGVHFTNSALAEAFHRVASAIASSDALSDHSKTVAIDSLEQVRATLEREPPDAPVAALVREVPMGVPPEGGTPIDAAGKQA